MWREPQRGEKERPITVRHERQQRRYGIEIHDD